MIYCQARNGISEGRWIGPVWFIETPQFQLLMIIFIVLHLWCIMCAIMEKTKEESGVGKLVTECRAKGGWERSGESDACSARGHKSAKKGVGSKRSVLSWSRRRKREEWGSRLVSVEERKDESGVGAWSKGRKREEWGMRVLGIAINKARGELALRRNWKSRHVSSC